MLTFSLQFNENINIDVNEKVKEFKNVVYHNVNKKNNAPNYIRVTWGETDFRGRLVNLDLSYSTFERNGKLKSAKANISVLGKSFENALPSSESDSSPRYEQAVTEPNAERADSPPPYEQAVTEPNAERTDSPSRYEQAVTEPNAKRADLERTNFSLSEDKTSISNLYSPSRITSIANRPAGSGVANAIAAVDTAANIAIGAASLKAAYDSRSIGVNIEKWPDGTERLSVDVYNKAPAGAYDGGPDRIYGGVDSSSSDSNASNLSGSNHSSSSRKSSNSLRTPKTSSVSVLTDIPTPKISPWQRLALMTKKVCTKGYHSTKKAVN